MTLDVLPDPSASARAWAGDVARDLLSAAPPEEARTFLDRLERTWPELLGALDAVYGDHPARHDTLVSLLTLLVERWSARPPELRLLDLERERTPDWFQTPDMVGYVLYVDRFAGTLRGVLDHVSYLRDLRVRYVHLMPLLATRGDDDDGGYAVVDYDAVQPRLGTMDDLEEVARRFREQGISTCIDLVLNHTAAEHPWATRAAAGDPTHEAYYRIYPNDVEPRRYEATLPEVFPDFAPGNFTRLPDGRWVWTTFHSWQWDLDWSNPTVFREMLGILLRLANRGIDVFRLDAVAFMWKRLGTNCQNQPEVHHLLRALRACARIVAPAVVFKAEAIVGPGDLAPYLGVAAPGVPAGRECDLAYHNTLMVQFWSSLATRDTRLMTHVLAGFPRKPTTAAWATYLRCHDDIGWAITDEDARAVGWEGAAHRAFLSDFYVGTFPGSFARGVLFQHNELTGDSRISGTMASLAGLEQALAMADPRLVDLAIARILAGHALVMGWDGIPLLYMGDELGLLNDWRYARQPRHADDSRWIHRPVMDWAAAASRVDELGVAGRIFAGIVRLVERRSRLPQLHAASPLEVVDLRDDRLFGYLRGGPEAPLIAIHNLTDDVVSLDPGDTGIRLPGDARDLITGRRIEPGMPIDLDAYGVRWVLGEPGSAVAR